MFIFFSTRMNSTCVTRYDNVADYSFTIDLNCLLLLTFFILNAILDLAYETSVSVEQYEITVSVRSTGIKTSQDAMNTYCFIQL